jgi:hypothetical protein
MQQIRTADAESRLKESNQQLMQQQGQIHDMKHDLRQQQSTRKQVQDQCKLELQKVSSSLRRENRDLRNTCDSIRQELHDERLGRTRDRSVLERGAADSAAKVVEAENSLHLVKAEVGNVWDGI